MTIQRESAAICAEVFQLLREERERQRLSKYALANKTGLSQQTIGYVERGMTAPSLDTILRMVRGLGTDMGSLIKSAERRARIGSST